MTLIDGCSGYSFELLILFSLVMRTKENYVTLIQLAILILLQSYHVLMLWSVGVLEALTHCVVINDN